MVMPAVTKLKSYVLKEGNAKNLISGLPEPLVPSNISKGEGSFLSDLTI